MRLPPRRMETIIKFRTGPEIVRKLDELAASNLGGTEVFLYQPGPLTRSLVLRYLIETAHTEIVKKEKEKAEKLAREKAEANGDHTDQAPPAAKKKTAGRKAKVQK